MGNTKWPTLVRISICLRWQCPSEVRPGKSSNLLPGDTAVLSESIKNTKICDRLSADGCME